MNILLAPVLIPLLGAIVCLWLRGSVALQRAMAGGVAALLPIVNLYLMLVVREEGIMVLRAGSWPGAFGIVFVADLFSTMLLFFSSLILLATWWFLASGGATKEGENHLLYPLLLVLATGVNWAFITGDLFNLFVSFEILLITSYVLMAHNNTRQQLREAIKFVILNIVASALFLITAGLTYGLFGTLNMAELAVKIARAGNPPEAVVLGTMYLLVFGMKGALFPLFFWLPDAYPKAPAGIVAYFSGILTKVGVYCLYRIFTLIFTDRDQFEGWFQPILLTVGGFTMFVGVMGAYAQMTFRRILSFHIISQIGYMIFGLGMLTPLAVACGLFYIMQHMVTKSALLLVSDTVIHHEGTDDLRQVGGIMKASPWLSIVFLTAALSLVGIPPLSGFYGKFGFILEGLRTGHYVLVVVAAVTALFTLASMAKIWRYSFWGDRREGNASVYTNRGVVGATTALVCASLGIACASGWLMDSMLLAAQAMLDREEYVGAVLGSRGLEALALAPAGGESP